MKKLTTKQIASRKNYRTQKGVITKIYGQQKRSAIKRNMALPTYSKQELIDAIIIMPLFKTLYKNWVNSNYATNLIPSIDRINDYISYTENNIQLMTWEENNKKSHLDRKEGRNNKGHREVEQFTLKEEYITTFYSIAQAARDTGAQQSNILKCCQFKRTKAAGFKWQYKENENENE